MPRKFTIGLGTVPLGSTVSAGTAVSVGTGSFSNVVLGNLPVVDLSRADSVPTQVVRSVDSAAAFHPTLFEDFFLRADPAYNFYTPDEASPSASVDPAAPPATLPRYIQISWSRAPQGSFPMISDKAVRPMGSAMPRPPLPTDFSTAARSIVNGYTAPAAVNALIVAPLPPPAPAPLADDAIFVGPRPVSARVSPEIARAVFVDPSIAAAVDPVRVGAVQDQAHAAVLASLSKILGSLEAVSEFNQDVPPRNPPPSFPVDPTTPAGRYVGYVLERYELRQDGTMVLSKTVEVPDPAVGSHIDRDVLYGARYAYRIRSVFQWTHPPGIGFSGPSTVDLPSGTGSLGPFSSTSVSSFYGGGWSDWARAAVLDTVPPEPPDELTVIPGSRKGLVRITWKMPPDIKRDISAVRLVRRRLDGSWEQLGEFSVGNGAWDDRSVVPDVRYVYAMCSVSFHGVVSALSDQVEAGIVSRPERGEVPPRRFSEPGARFGDHAVIVRRRPGPPISAKDRVSFSCRTGRTDLGLSSRDYLVEIQSLSTGERTVVGLTAESRPPVQQRPGNARRKA